MILHMKRKSMLEIIEETVKYYNEDPSRRAVSPFDGLRCEYIIPESGNRCAVGRYMINPYKFIGKLDGGVSDLITISDESLTQEDLVEEVRGHCWDFWGDLQGLHDRSLYWGSKGLTEIGTERFEQLKR